MQPTAIPMSNVYGKLSISNRSWNLYAKFIALEDIKRVTTLSHELDNNKLDHTITNKRRSI